MNPQWQPDTEKQKNNNNKTEKQKNITNATSNSSEPMNNVRVIHSSYALQERMRNARKTTPLEKFNNNERPIAISDAANDKNTKAKIKLIFVKKNI